MENDNEKSFTFPSPITKLNNVKFSSREIDVLACIVGGRTAKKIASFLSLSPRTVENYIRNLTLKLECNSRESLIDFVEKSDNFFLIKEHYSSLLIQAEFEKSLREIAKLIYNEPLHCLLVHGEKQESKKSFVYLLQKHLKLMNLTVSLEATKEFNISEDVVELQISSVSELQATPSSNESIVLFLEEENSEYILGKLKELGKENVINDKNYFFLVFKVIKTLFPQINIETIILEFKEKYEAMSKSRRNIYPQPSLDAQKLEIKDTPAQYTKTSFYKKKIGYIVSASLLMGLLSIGFFIIRETQEANKTKEKHFIQAYNQKNQHTNPIRSDLVLPTESSLLTRDELIFQIDSKFNNQRGIQTIALIGQGGSGKTTLARQYARQKNRSIVWEINAETHENLIRSFENLAEALAKTEDDKKILMGVQEIKDSLKRDKKIIQFVKERFKTHPSWLLIYDNVEKLADILKAFPNDPTTWGKGMILITTRDSNIQSDSQINHSLFIDELTTKQKLDLFIKITNNNHHQNLSATQKKEIESFLEKIPSFPLDVSIAAYYIKSTGVPYEGYLSYISQNSKNFETTQENILKDGSSSTKTRHSIIILSLQKLIETHKDFGDLLLLISLLNSQNIPRDLLVKYKKDIVDSFIFHLKRYSLIRANPVSYSPAIQTLSIHRSTQAISLAYLTEKLDLRKNKERIAAISNILENYLADAIDQDDITKMRGMYHHIISFFNHSHLVPEEERGKILSVFGYIESYIFKDNIKAKTNIEESYLIANKYYKEGDLRLGRVLVSLGIVYRKLGEYEKGRDFLERGLIIYRNHFPENHSQMGWVLANLGHVYRSLGDSKKAKEMLEQALENYKINIPKNKSEYIRTIISLGVNYNDMGEYKKSAELLNQSLQTHKKYFSENHPNMTFILGYLGEAYRTLGEYEKAKEILEQGFALQKGYFPHSSNENNWFMYLLGKVYSALGEYKKARIFLEKALAYYEKNYGKEHVETAHAIRCIGETYYLEEKLDLASVWKETPGSVDFLRISPQLMT